MERTRSFQGSHRRKSSLAAHQHHPPPQPIILGSAASQGSAVTASSGGGVSGGTTTGVAASDSSSFYASEDETDENDLLVLGVGGTDHLNPASSFQSTSGGGGKNDGHRQYDASSGRDTDDEKVHHPKGRSSLQRLCCCCRRFDGVRRSAMMRWNHRAASLVTAGLCNCGIRWAVLVVLCLQNSLFTVLRRYSQGVLRESYSKYECLLLGEFIKIVFSAWMIRAQLLATSKAEPSVEDRSSSSQDGGAGAAGTRDDQTSRQRLLYLLQTSRKMFVLAGMYGAMNILSFVALRNISAGLFTIIAQAKIVTTAVFSSLLLQRTYTPTQWRALIALVLGVLLFSEPVWNRNTVEAQPLDPNDPQRPWIGTAAVLIEVTLSGFASIYFEKVIKLDPLQLTIWERNFQLALGSVPVYVVFILHENAAGRSPGQGGVGSGWTPLAFVVAALGAAGGLLVALSIKYGDSILKTLATTGAIVLSSVLDHVWLHGPLTLPMIFAGCQVILAICNYTFDTTPAVGAAATAPPTASRAPTDAEGKKRLHESDRDEEMALLLQPSGSAEMSRMKRPASRADSLTDG